ncbi:major facilitator superfamily protein [Pseudomonas putida]|uniref:Major facilitator superfamily protein n=1 Tax=Pseudomonas putida TaxID=303 RepID=A0A379KNX5_PSEPU|nr:MFS transporter [Pseudomonas putida]SUD69752.1 major facilitator superfamily protein [Pseudomonas putida]
MSHLSDTPHRSPIVRVAFASFIGTLIEYFDFFLFGTAAALIFNKVFFPTLDPLLGTLAAFGAFGAAFVARPLGGVIFGHFGDRLGRKAMLVLSLLMMGLSTLSVGLMPTYEQVGVLAPILLLTARLIQGIAIGGEWSGAVLMAVEHAPPGRRAFYGSWPQCGIPAGLVLATSSFYLVQLLPDDQMMSWGWRVPFIASALLVVLGLYIRLKITETPEFAEIKREGREARFPVTEVVTKAWRSVLITMFSMAAPNIIFYIATVFILQYGSKTLGMPRSTVLGAVCLASFIQVFTIPFIAILADKYGRRPVLMTGCVLTMIFAYPIFWLVDSGNTLNVYLALILCLPVLHAATYGPLASFVTEQFDTHLRYTGSAIGYHGGGMIHSGPVPFIATTLVAWSGGSWPLALYIMFGGLLTFIAVSFARETAPRLMTASKDSTLKKGDALIQTSTAP